MELEFDFLHLNESQLARLYISRVIVLDQGPGLSEGRIEVWRISRIGDIV